MSDLEWDAEEFVPPPPPSGAAELNDKWEGEDEEVGLKDDWDDESQNNNEPAQAKKKKKKLQDIIAEKERRLKEDLERRQKLKEDEQKMKSSEEILAEKLRLQKIQEDSDLQIAVDLLGSETKTDASFDSFDLSTEENLIKFRVEFIKKIRSVERLEKRPYYVRFIEDLSSDLCDNLESDEVKRVTTTLNSLYNDKVKANKPTKGKKKGNKAKLNPGQGAITDDIANDYSYGEYDDFI